MSSPYSQSQESSLVPRRSASPELFCFPVHNPSRRNRSPSPVYRSKDTVDLEEFPTFSNGDVLFITPAGQNFKVHASVVKGASSVLAKMIEEATLIKLTKAQKLQGKTIIYKIKMTPCDIDDRLVDFIPQDPKVKNLSFSFHNLNGLGTKPPYLEIYNNLFRCLYNIDLEFQGGSKQVRDIIPPVIGLLQAAEKIKCERSVRRTIESCLLGYGHQLWVQIAAQPEAWSDVACRLQSPVIFREAMCHLVGAWNMVDVINKNILNSLKFGPEIVDLIKCKVTELDMLKKSIEQEIMNWWPPSMMHAAVLGKLPGRFDYASDIYQWIGLMLIRQYFSEAISNELNYRRADGGAQLYRQISTGNAAYLTRYSLGAFYQNFQMTPKGQVCFEDTLHGLKEGFRPFVARFLVDRTQTTGVNGTGGVNYQYLTCVEIKNEEMPWKARSQVAIVPRHSSADLEATRGPSDDTNIRDTPSATRTLVRRGMPTKGPSLPPSAMPDHLYRAPSEDPGFQSFFNGGRQAAEAFGGADFSPSGISVMREQAILQAAANLNAGHNSLSRAENAEAESILKAADRGAARRASRVGSRNSRFYNEAADEDMDENKDIQDMETDDYGDDNEISVGGYNDEEGGDHCILDDEEEDDEEDEEIENHEDPCNHTENEHYNEDSHSDM